MPYMPINKCLPVIEDIRLQHRNSKLATELSRTTNFNEVEVQRLLQMHYMLTEKRGEVMHREMFVEFMDLFLGVRNVDAMEKMHQIRCKTNKRHMTGREFVELMSLLLKGSLPNTIKLCFDVYTEIIQSPVYVRKADVLALAARNGHTEYDQCYADHVMRVVDKDRDNRISLEDYRKTVNEDVLWLQFLGPVLPEPDRAETFFRLFSKRPYVNNIDTAWVNQRHGVGVFRHKTVTMVNESLDTPMESLVSLDNDSVTEKTNNAMPGGGVGGGGGGGGGGADTSAFGWSFF